MSRPVEQISQEAIQASVDFIATGTHPGQWAWVEDRTPHAAFGLHPTHCLQTGDWLADLEETLVRNPLSAIGEIGLDFRKGMPPCDIQIEHFENQLSLAKTLNRPVIIHAVKAHSEVVASIKRVKWDRFVIHAFTGSEMIANDYLSLGGYLSAGGLMTRIPRPKALNVFQSMPRNRLLLETDAPDLPPLGHLEGSPAHLPLIGQSLALDLNLSVSALQQMSTQNAQALFDYDFAQLS